MQHTNQRKYRGTKYSYEHGAETIWLEHGTLRRHIFVRGTDQRDILDVIALVTRPLIDPSIFLFFLKKKRCWCIRLVDDDGSIV
jgi:hypothetical protein